MWIINRRIRFDHKNFYTCRVAKLAIQGLLISQGLLRLRLKCIGILGLGEELSKSGTKHPEYWLRGVDSDALGDPSDDDASSRLDLSLTAFHTPRLASFFTVSTGSPH